ncbi:hypothetical protein RIF29_45458 [Crotalaria pallida]|uniref:Uncharacterized protein n=1 Tax=Crotalaria pallida TaxID=3830 RepID=A0AAN9HL84_CROPI
MEDFSPPPGFILNRPICRDDIQHESKKRKWSPCSFKSRHSHQDRIMEEKSRQVFRRLQALFQLRALIPLAPLFHSLARLKKVPTLKCTKWHKVILFGFGQEGQKRDAFYQSKADTAPPHAPTVRLPRKRKGGPGARASWVGV